MPIFSARSDRTLLPAEPANRLVEVTLHVPRPEGAQVRKAVHLSLVIDRSGSMAGDKLRLALDAARQAIRSLQHGDRFSVVTFDERVEVPVPSTEATPAAQRRAEAALGMVTSRGSTDLGGGWLRGCAEVGAHLPEDAIGRCLLLTDGQANHGITAPEELTRHARELRLRRVTTSTIGLGEGFNEFLLGRLSEEGGGSFYFAERAAQIPELVARELGEVLSVVARDASLVLHAPEGAEVESLNDYPCCRSGTSFSFSLGSLSGGLLLRPMFRVRLPAGPVLQKLSVTIELTDRDGALPKEPRALSWTRATSEQLRAESADADVIRAAAALDAARARRAALSLNDSGAWNEATARLAESANQIRAYAAGDPEALTQANELDAEQAAYSAPMTSLGKKDRYFRAMMSMKMGARHRLGSQILGLSTAAPLGPLLETATQALAGVKGAPTFGVDLSLQTTSLPPGPLSQGDESRVVAEAVALDPAAVKVVFVEQSLPDGWFSHWQVRSRTAVISLAGLGQLISLPAASFVAYELLLYGLHALSADYEPAKLLHSETRACLFDLCQNKAEVGIKIQAGHICAPCLGQLATLGLDRDQVIALWRAVQTLAQPTASPRR